MTGIVLQPDVMFLKDMDPFVQLFDPLLSTGCAVL